MSDKGISLDELLEARERVNAQKARTQAKVTEPEFNAEDLTIFRLLGLWLLITGLIVLKVIAAMLVALAEAVEWLRRERTQRSKPRRRR